MPSVSRDGANRSIDVGRRPSQMPMHERSCCAAAVLLFASGCAVAPPAQLTECLQPNRRVDVEVSGTTMKPAPKPQSALAKPAPPALGAIRFQAVAQGDSAFDVGAAVLKAQGATEFDLLAEEIEKRKVRVGSIIVVGHTDKVEEERFAATLSEDRAKAVVAYLAAKGMDTTLMFWEGKGSRNPLPVTKFCD